MGESCIRGNVSHGDGVYRSTDAGKTWTHVGLRDTMQIGRIRVHPRDPDLVYVAALGHTWGPNAERGVFRSKDGGKTWSKVLFVDDRTGAVDLAMDPANPRVLYAAFWQAQRTPWSLESGGPGSGLYKSTDGGDTWKKLDGKGLPKGAVGPRRRERLAGPPGPRLRARRGRGGRRLPLRRRRRDLGADERRAEAAAAGLVLHPRLRRPEGARHRLRAQRAALPLARTAGRPSRRSACPTGTTTTSGSRPRTRAA